MPEKSNFPINLTNPYLSQLRSELDSCKILMGRMAANANARTQMKSLHECEFQVFSQFGDDGIIQYLISDIGIRPERQTFIEFGVESFLESNTRFLLENNNWKGLIIDANSSWMNAIYENKLAWRHDLTAVTSFITAENINGIFVKHGFEGEIGILSIDIDGVDYWVWKAITAVNPMIVIAEYNSVFGKHAPVTVPYSPTFNRTTYHSSTLCWGASLAALEGLANEKGYDLLGCNLAGNNAYFLRRDVVCSIPRTKSKDGFVESRFRESRDTTGRLTFASGAQRRTFIEDCKVVDTVSQATLSLKEAWNKYGY